MKKINWDVIRKLWEKNGYPSSYRLQSILNKKGITVDDGNIRRSIRKWRKEINFLKKYSPINNGKKAWERIKEDSHIFIEQHEYENEKLFYLENEKSPIGIAFISDQHFGNVGVDYERAEADAKLVAQTEGLYAVLGGDAIDNFINTKIMPATINSKSSPSDQADMLIHYLNFFNGYIIALISGNHEFWTKKYCGIDFYELINLNLDCIIPDGYSKHESKITTFVGDIEYRIMLRHRWKCNSMFNLCHTVKRLWEHTDWDFDIGVICHGHQTAFEPFKRHGKKIWAIRPGSYKIVDTYADEKGFYGVEAACPTAILYPNKKKIQVFDDINDAVKTLKAVRAE